MIYIIALPNWTNWESATKNGAIFKLRMRQDVINNQKAEFELDINVPWNVFANYGFATSFEIKIYEDDGL